MQTLEQDMKMKKGIVKSYQTQSSNQKNNIIQFTHGRDLDGKISGMVGEIYAKCNNNNIKVEYVDNSSEFNEIIVAYINNKFCGYDTIIISDLTLNERNAESINDIIDLQKEKTFIICDHHKADYITENKAYIWNKNCSRSEDKQCGASLLYNVLKIGFPSKYRKVMNLITDKTRIYDNFIWKDIDDFTARDMSRICHLNENYIEELKQRVLKFDGLKDTFELFSSLDTQMLDEENENIENYIDMKKDETCIEKIIIDDKEYTVACLFAAKYQSELGNRICDLMDVDFVCMLNPENNSISLRGHDRIDLSKVAKKYFNGGGHFNAAGGRFESFKLLFNITDIFR